MRVRLKESEFVPSKDKVGELNMTASFSAALALQGLSVHKTFLKKFGFQFVDDHADEARKLHDLHDWADEAWFECKLDKSGFTNRLLLEYKANVPDDLVAEIPLRTPFRRSEWLAKVKALPSRYDALALDVENLERRHFVSYHFERTGKTFLFDLRELRKVVAEDERHGLEFLRVGHNHEPWSTLAVAVPLDLVRPLAPSDVWAG